MRSAPNRRPGSPRRRCALSRSRAVLRPASIRAALPLFLAASVATAAGGDDWPQFRRDDKRSAASSDPVKLPLTEIWAWTTSGHTPLYHSVIHRDRIFFTAFKDLKRYLICAEAKTGTLHWSRELASPKLSVPHSDAVGPAVSKAGLIFVYDELPLYQLIKKVEQFNGGPENKALWRSLEAAVAEAARFSLGYANTAAAPARGIPPSVTVRSLGGGRVEVRGQVDIRSGDPDERA